MCVYTRLSALNDSAEEVLLFMLQMQVEPALVNLQ